MLNVISLFGLFAMVGLAWAMSSGRRNINWRLVGLGICLQLIIAGILFNSQTWTFNGQFENGILFYAIDQFFAVINDSVEAGTGFMFDLNPEPDDPIPVNSTIMLSTFAFGVLPTVIFFASLMSILYYLGIMHWIVRGMASIMQRTLGTSGAETLAAAANVFVGHTEAPLVVRPFLASMTRSEMMALMVGGFATITGGLLAAFVKFGISAGHLVVASIVSAPAALVIAKILVPETERPETLGTLDTKLERNATNIIDAAAVGARDGMKLAINIAAMLIAFLALIALVDIVLGGAGNLTSWIVNASGLVESPVDYQWSLKLVFGHVFAPLAFLMGIEWRDCLAAGNYLGQKMVVNEFVAYLEMGNDIKAAAANPDDESLVRISERTEVILTYALAGFSNFGAIAIQIGGIGALAPERRKDLAQLGLRAMFGGMLACCMTACIAGFLYGLF